ncbi:hypothetical protein ABW19_dt0206242 [Dactylella cylindrospora]|nr:hypothetical protein ABW19_dt0206242 [Dactylella cylindrospora]
MPYFNESPLFHPDHIQYSPTSTGTLSTPMLNRIYSTYNLRIFYPTSCQHFNLQNSITANSLFPPKSQPKSTKKIRVSPVVLLPRSVVFEHEPLEPQLYNYRSTPFLVDCMIWHLASGGERRDLHIHPFSLRRMAVAVFSLDFLLWVLVFSLMVVLLAPIICIFLIFSEFFLPSACGFSNTFPLSILPISPTQKKINISPFRCTLSFHLASRSVSPCSVAYQKNRSFTEEVNTIICFSPFCKRGWQERWKVRLLTWRRDQNLSDEAVYRQQKFTASLGFSWNGRGWIADRRYRFRCHQPHHGTHGSILADVTLRNTIFILRSFPLSSARVLVLYLFLAPLRYCALSCHSLAFSSSSSLKFSVSLNLPPFRPRHRDISLSNLKGKSWSLVLCFSQYPIPLVRFILLLLLLFPHIRPSTLLDIPPFPLFMFWLEIIDGFIGYCNIPLAPFIPRCPFCPRPQMQRLSSTLRVPFRTPYHTPTFFFIIQTNPFFVYYSYTFYTI